MQKLHVKKNLMPKKIACRNGSSWYINTNVLLTKSKEENNSIHTMIFSYTVDPFETQASNILQYKTIVMCI